MVLWHIMTIGELGETHGFHALRDVNYNVSMLQLFDDATCRFFTRLFDPLHKTPSVDECRDHPWMQGEIAKEDEVKRVLGRDFPA